MPPPWIDLTTGNYHGVVAAARNGIEAAPHHNVAIRLLVQEAKAWARIGDRRQTLDIEPWAHASRRRRPAE